jgi:outer membrane receptor for monomeric catechols
VPLTDFLLGSASAWNQGNPNQWYLRQNYTALYLQDAWKLSPRLTLNYGLRWEPFQTPYAKYSWFAHYDPALFAQNAHSTVYVNAPAGMIFPGDPQSQLSGT